MKDFVNLRVHSSYSIKDGLMSPEEIVDIAAANGEKAVAITDLGYMLKAVSFYEYARKKGVKPIIGCDVFIERDITDPNDFDDVDNFEPTRMILLAKNEEGYKNLNELMSRANTENQKEDFKDYKGIGFIKQSWLTPDVTKNIIGLSGEISNGDIVGEILAGNNDRALEKALFYKERFGGNYFIEVQRYNHKNEYEAISGNLDIAQKAQIPIVATHPVQFKEASDYYFHEVRSCVSSKEEVYDINRDLKFTQDQYYKNNKEINEIFKDLPNAIEGSTLIADMCNVKLKLNINDLPSFPTGEKSEDQYLIDRAREGLEIRMLENFPDPEERKQVMDKYQKRLDFELDVINKMGFPGYFLIVYEFINWSKSQDIMVGPGRGSGAGSLVAYSLGITDLDPLPYNLFFERFLNPERVSMPDFDIDFDQVEREKVIGHVHEMYDKNGQISVSQIATYGLLKAKAVIKAAARALSLPYVVADQISKKIPNDPKIKLDDVICQDWLIESMSQNKDIETLIEACKKLENIPTSIGVHAGGVVIGKSRLTDYTPLARADMNSTIFSQYDKNEVEVAGLVKFDFLSLSNLTVINKAVISVNKREEFKNDPFKISKISLKDQNVFKMFREGNSIAVFQFEGQGMRNTLKLISPDRFEDLIAIVSLFRPGPMKMIPDYARKKAGEKVEYAHPMLEESLSETYGIMIYQEQVMQVAQKIAGYTLGQADQLRRAMGKKKASEMKSHRETFRNGAEKNGIDNKKADEIFDLMEEFANYGFNKSHAAAYALISYQTAYLKTYYPSEYFTAFLNVEVMDKASKNSDKVELLLNDARNNGLNILPPNINNSNAQFTFEGENVRYGLSGIKGVSADSINEIKEDLEKNGEYASFEDFYKRIGVKTKKTVIENLIFAGVFDELNNNRAALFNAMPEFLKYKDTVKKNEVNRIKNAEREIENAPIIAENEKIEEVNDLIANVDMKDEKAVSELVEKIREFDPEFELPENKKKIKPLKLKKLKSLLKYKDETLPTIENNVDDWTEVAKFNYEKNVYGFYLTGHPYKYYRQEMSNFNATFPLSDVEMISPSDEGDTILISGIIHGIEKKKTRNGDPMWITSIGDGKDVLTMFMFKDVIEKHEDKLKVGDFVSMQTKIKSAGNDTGKNYKNIEDMFTFSEVKSKLVKGVNIRLDSSQLTDLTEIINEHPGNMKITLYTLAKNGDYAMVNVDEKKFGVSGSQECIRRIEETFGKNNVVLKIHDKMVFSNNYKYKLKP